MKGIGVVLVGLGLALTACGSEDVVGSSTESTSDVVSSTTAASTTLSSSTNQIPELPSALEQDPRAAKVQPVDLTIESLGVTSAPVDSVGVEANGEYEVPGATTVGWYQFGSSPTEQGSTVMAAHIAYQGQDGVFRNLDRLQVGEELSVTLADGTEATYVVTEKAQYDKTELPFDRIFRRDGPAELVLITCGGDFNTSVSSYQDNVVAYASPA